jgi:hypothetical protein
VLIQNHSYCWSLIIVIFGNKLTWKKSFGFFRWFCQNSVMYITSTLQGTNATMHFYMKRFFSFAVNFYHRLVIFSNPYISDDVFLLIQTFYISLNNHQCIIRIVAGWVNGNVSQTILFHTNYIKCYFLFKKLKE